MQKENSLTVGRWCEQWFAANRHRWNGNTEGGYHNLICNHIFPGIGSIAISALTEQAVTNFYNSLRSQGYEIDAVQNRGYCLSEKTDILSAQGIHKYLQPVCKELDLHVLPLAQSTNTLVREKADAGAPEGCVILANAQTQGRGRLGRAFYSPEDTGIYMS